MRKIASNKKIQAILSNYDVVSIETGIFNQSGYGYLQAEKEKHTLADGSYLSVCMSFSTAKAQSIPVVVHFDKEGVLVSRLLN